MASIGELVVNLRVKSEVKKIEIFEKRVKTLSTRLRDLRNAAMVLRFALRLFNSASARVNELNERLEQTSTSAKNLNLPDVQVTRFAEELKRAGIDAEKFFTVLSKINDLRKDIGRGGDQKISALNVFKDIGIDAMDANNELKSTVTLFDEIIARSNELDVDSRGRLDDMFGGTQFFQELRRENPGARLADAMDNNSKIMVHNVENAKDLSDALRGVTAAIDNLIAKVTPFFIVITRLVEGLLFMLDEIFSFNLFSKFATNTLVGDDVLSGIDGAFGVDDEFFRKKAEREQREVAQRQAERRAGRINAGLEQPGITFNNTNNITGSDPKETGSVVESVMERTYGDFVSQAIERILSNNEERE